MENAAPESEGEVWTRKVLAELKEARFAPRAWTRFLARSLERARERRRELARAHRQVVVLAAAGLAAWAAVAAAGRPWLALAGATWWWIVSLMLDWHLGMLERPDGRTLCTLGLPNVLSLARLSVVPVVVVLPHSVAAGLLLAAGAADVLDGPLARRRDEVTRLGFWLDGAADSLLLSAAAVAVLPGWAAALVLTRYLLPWPALAVAYFYRGEAPSRERWISGRVPGLVTFAGLVLAFFDLGAGAAISAVGAVGGLVVLAPSGARWAARPAPRTLIR
jgi:phosphatidylglycerophosphate synthase